MCLTSNAVVMHCTQHITWISSLTWVALCYPVDLAPFEVHLGSMDNVLQPERGQPTVENDSTADVAPATNGEAITSTSPGEAGTVRGEGVSKSDAEGNTLYGHDEWKGYSRTRASSLQQQQDDFTASLGDTEQVVDV